MGLCDDSIFPENMERFIYCSTFIIIGKLNV